MLDHKLRDVLDRGSARCFAVQTLQIHACERVCVLGTVTAFHTKFGANGFFC